MMLYTPHNETGTMPNNFTTLIPPMSPDGFNGQLDIPPKLFNLYSNELILQINKELERVSDTAYHNQNEIILNCYVHIKYPYLVKNNSGRTCLVNRKLINRVKREYLKSGWKYCNIVANLTDMFDQCNQNYPDPFSDLTFGNDYNSYNNWYHQDGIGSVTNTNCNCSSNCDCDNIGNSLPTNPISVNTDGEDPCVGLPATYTPHKTKSNNAINLSLICGCPIKIKPAYLGSLKFPNECDPAKLALSTSHWIVRIIFKQ